MCSRIVVALPLPLVIILVLLAVHTRAQPMCNPLLVLVEGGSASSDGSSMEALARDLFDRYSKEERTTVVSVDNGYFFSPKWWSLWTIPHVGDVESENMDTVATMIRDSGHWPVVLVGHSLGGSTAYEIASSTPTSLLVTLDAVSSPDNVPSLDMTWWINVFAHNHLFKGDSIGEDWEHEPNADSNIRMKKTSHSAARSMFERVEGDILNVLRSCYDRPQELPRKLDISVTTGLCRVDQINCAYAANLLR